MEQVSKAAHMNSGPRPLAYSYVRFSSVKQELGDSLNRQVEAAEEYCREHNLRLDTKSYRDLGVSAFKRHNIEKGALSRFIEAVNTGKIATGSYLIIEQFDRLSRADAHVALRLLMGLVDSGIKVVTLFDRKVWDTEAIKDATNLMLAVVYMSRANNESAAKADRLAKVWKRKKDRAADGTAARIVTSECPRWLRANESKTGFDVVDEIAASIKRVFDLRINGFGIVAIVSRANSERWPAPGKPSVRKAGESPEDFARRKTESSTWHTSLVGRLLKNRALIGEYQPRCIDPNDDTKRVPYGEPIKHYYPSVLDEPTFLRAQATADRRGRFPGRRDATGRNWLYGLAQCSCGHSLVRKNKNSQKQPGYARYYCTARVRGASECPGVNSQELEHAVLYVCSHYLPQFIGAAPVDELRAQADILEGQVLATKKVMGNYVDAIGKATTPITTSTLVRQLEAEEAKLGKHEAALAGVRARLADRAGIDHEAVLANIARMALAPDNPDQTVLLREELARTLEKIEVDERRGYIRVYVKGWDVPTIHPLRQDLSGFGWEQPSMELQREIERERIAAVADDASSKP
ncbi:recombinase family protein [Paraburkholderia sp. CNPSo 3274]|uniref:recombinase family protein n=1 Tax=Paraburkholderia sp. CNPSo 3274 TaxID=2940932 RepID=UPI0020B6D3D9|nr:recombinase family protein [Paraburkholderia sp. CNPSo 3274]MCP3713134.1 recombinase family protein [Paraburkholderia sp. CNPSo 3274]